MSVFLPRRFFIVFLSGIYFLLSGCATPTQSVNFKSAIGNASFSPRQKAETTKKTSTQLVRQDYVRIGDLDIEYIIAKCEGMSKKNCSPVKHDTTPSVRLLTEAASRGGDLVRFTKDNKKELATRYNKGSCLKTRTSSHVVQVPTYSYDCRKVDNNTECKTTQRGTKLQTQNETVCVQHEQLPYTVKTLHSTGTVWRHDKKYSANERRRQVLEHGSRKQVKRLLRDKKGMTTVMLNNEYPLLVALKSDNAEAIKAMLDLGMEPNSRTSILVHDKEGRKEKERENPLTVAIVNNAEKCVATLLQHGASSAYVSEPPKLALITGNPRILNTLLAHGARLDTQYTDPAITVFPGATKKHKLKLREVLLKILLKHGAKINTRNKYDETALFSAAAAADPDAVKLLLKYAANTKIRDRMFSGTPLEIAIHRRKHNPHMKEDYDAVIALLR